MLGNGYHLLLCLFTLLNKTKRKPNNDLYSFKYLRGGDAKDDEFNQVLCSLSLNSSLSSLKPSDTFDKLSTETFVFSTKYVRIRSGPSLWGKGCWRTGEHTTWQVDLAIRDSTLNGRHFLILCPVSVVISFGFGLSSPSEPDFSRAVVSHATGPLGEFIVNH